MAGLVEAAGILCESGTQIHNNQVLAVFQFLRRKYNKIDIGLQNRKKVLGL
jgi:hypothetical protein